MLRKIFLSMIIGLTAIFAFQGCGTTRTTERETRTTYVDEDAATRDNVRTDDIDDAKVERTEVEKTQTKTTSEQRGVLGTTIHFIGQVLAFPFKLVAGVIESIF